MAVVRIDGDALCVELAGAEKVAACHGDVRVPLRAVRTVEVVDNPLQAVHGLRAPGTGLPGVLAVGTWRAPGVALFAVVRRGERAVRVMLAGGPFTELLIGCADPERVADAIRTALASA